METENRIARIKKIKLGQDIHPRHSIMNVVRHLPKKVIGQDFKQKLVKEKT